MPLLSNPARRRRVFPAMLVLSLLAGCAVPPPDGDPTLTDAQRAAVDDVVAEMQALGLTLASFSDFNATVPEDRTCPATEVSFSSECALVATTHDYGSGCTTDSFAGATISGSVIVCRTGAAFDGIAVVFESLSIGGTTITGSVTLTFTDDMTDGAALEGTIDLATSTGGSVQGSILFTYEFTDGTLVIPEAELAFNAAGGDSYAATIDGVEMDPVDHGSFIPQAGTLTFDIPNDGLGPDTVTMVVTFTAQSPVDGTVDVSVAGSAGIEYQIPGVGA